MDQRETVILQLIQYRANKQGFSDDMRLVSEAIAIRKLSAGASAHRAITEGMIAANNLAQSTNKAHGNILNTDIGQTPS